MQCLFFLSASMPHLVASSRRGVTRAMYCWKLFVINFVVALHVRVGSSWVELSRAYNRGYVKDAKKKHAIFTQ